MIWIAGYLLAFVWPVLWWIADAPEGYELDGVGFFYGTHRLNAGVYRLEYA